MQEMIDWFCKDKSLTIRDLQLSGRKLSISDLLSPCEVMSIPGEAVDADLTVLKRFFSDDAWNKLLMLLSQLKESWSCHLCQQSRYMDMIQCESCLHWFDWECANLQEEPDEWTCTTCLPPKKFSKKENST
ncbi:uncharacterized protein [Porites lutea]|uniref:uncharacterized protein n=1 Tax=Porites lutea TaxID=51062 RepID=UPI003CC6495A